MSRGHQTHLKTNLPSIRTTLRTKSLRTKAIILPEWLANSLLDLYVLLYVNCI